MKSLFRYIGNYLTVFLAFAYLLLLLLPVMLAVIILNSQMNYATAFITLMCIMTVIVLIIYGKKVSLFSQLYTWCIFEDDGVAIKTLFSKKYKLYYTQCRDIGVIYYIHGILNSRLGSKQFFIYLSYDMIPAKCINEANHLIPTKTTIKISYNKSTFNYLTSVLPKKQKEILMNNTVNFLNDLSLE